MRLVVTKIHRKWAACHNCYVIIHVIPNKMVCTGYFKVFITLSHEWIYLSTSISSAVYLCPWASHDCGLINGWGFSRKGLGPRGKCVLTGAVFTFIFVDLSLQNGFVKGSLNASALKQKHRRIVLVFFLHLCFCLLWDRVSIKRLASNLPCSNLALKPWSSCLYLLGISFKLTGHKTYFELVKHPKCKIS